MIRRCVVAAFCIGLGRLRGAHATQTPRDAPSIWDLPPRNAAGPFVDASPKWRRESCLFSSFRIFEDGIGATQYVGQSDILAPREGYDRAAKRVRQRHAQPVYKSLDQALADEVLTSMFPVAGDLQDLSGERKGRGVLSDGGHFADSVFGSVVCSDPRFRHFGIPIPGADLGTMIIAVQVVDELLIKKGQSRMEYGQLRDAIRAYMSEFFSFPSHRIFQVCFDRSALDRFAKMVTKDPLTADELVGWQEGLSTLSEVEFNSTNVGSPYMSDVLAHRWAYRVSSDLADFVVAATLEEYGRIRTVPPPASIITIEDVRDHAEPRATVLIDSTDGCNGHTPLVQQQPAKGTGFLVINVAATRARVVRAAKFFATHFRVDVDAAARQASRKMSLHIWAYIERVAPSVPRFVVSPAVGYKSIDELVSAQKDRPAAVKFTWAEGLSSEVPFETALRIEPKKIAAMIEGAKAVREVPVKFVLQGKRCPTLISDDEWDDLEDALADEREDINAQLPKQGTLQQLRLAAKGISVSLTARLQPLANQLPGGSAILAVRALVDGEMLPLPKLGSGNRTANPAPRSQEPPTVSTLLELGVRVEEATDPTAPMRPEDARYVAEDRIVVNATVAGFVSVLPNDGIVRRVVLARRPNFNQPLLPVVTIALDTRDATCGSGGNSSLQCSHGTFSCNGTELCCEPQAANKTIICCNGANLEQCVSRSLACLPPLPSCSHVNCTPGGPMQQVHNCSVNGTNTQRVLACPPPLCDCSNAGPDGLVHNCTANGTTLETLICPPPVPCECTPGGPMQQVHNCSVNGTMEEHVLACPPPPCDCSKAGPDGLVHNCTANGTTLETLICPPPLPCECTLGGPMEQVHNCSVNGTTQEHVLACPPPPCNCSKAGPDGLVHNCILDGELQESLTCSSTCACAPGGPEIQEQYCMSNGTWNFVRLKCPRCESYGICNGTRTCCHGVDAEPDLGQTCCFGGNCTAREDVCRCTQTKYCEGEDRHLCCTPFSFQYRCMSNFGFKMMELECGRAGFGGSHGDKECTGPNCEDPNIDPIPPGPTPLPPSPPRPIARLSKPKSPFRPIRRPRPPVSAGIIPGCRASVFTARHSGTTTPSNAIARLALEQIGADTQVWELACSQPGLCSAVPYQPEILQFALHWSSMLTDADSRYQFASISSLTGDMGELAVMLMSAMQLLSSKPDLSTIAAVVRLFFERAGQDRRTAQRQIFYSVSKETADAVALHAGVDDIMRPPTVSKARKIALLLSRPTHISSKALHALVSNPARYGFIEGLVETVLWNVLLPFFRGKVPEAASSAKLDSSRVAFWVQAGYKRPRAILRITQTLSSPSCRDAFVAVRQSLETADGQPGNQVVTLHEEAARSERSLWAMLVKAAWSHILPTVTSDALVQKASQLAERQQDVLLEELFPRVPVVEVEVSDAIQD